MFGTPAGALERVRRDLGYRIGASRTSLRYLLGADGSPWHRPFVSCDPPMTDVPSATPDTTIPQLVIPGPEVPRFLVELNPRHLPSHEVDVLVVGGGVAGLSAAVASAEHVDTLVLLKGGRGQSNTAWAQGGMAAVLGDEDTIEEHVGDTLRLGAGLCHEDVVRSIVGDGPRIVSRWLEWGGEFDRDATGALRLAMEGGHSHERIIHANGDQTGFEIQRLLIARASLSSRIQVMEQTFVLDLIKDEGVVRGAVAWSQQQGFFTVWAGSVILATGGGGQLYRETTNPKDATADGVAMAYRAGAQVRGLEFVQFHPTALYVAGMARFLVSETARGEGGVLRDRHGHAFMADYHPDAELAPRDVVSRAIVRHLGKVRDSNVWLDMRHLDADHLRRRFPVINRACQDFGLDMSTEMIPVHPACHYMIGGVSADADGRTTLDALYACGEAACTGFHGANRMGSNSLLEGAVCGWRAGQDAATSRRRPEARAAIQETERRAHPGLIDLDDLDNAMRSLMWRLVGIERDAPGLAAARSRLEQWNHLLASRVFSSPEGWVLTNEMLAARMVAEAASLRFESRGTHFRRDNDALDDDHWRKDVCIVRPDRA